MFSLFFFQLNPTGKGIKREMTDNLEFFIISRRVRNVKNLLTFLLVCIYNSHIHYYLQKYNLNVFLAKFWVFLNKLSNRNKFLNIKEIRIQYFEELDDFYDFKFHFFY